MFETTNRQREVLRFINTYHSLHHYPPTFREIAAKFSVSVRAAHDHVEALKKKGYVQNEYLRSRSIKLTEYSSVNSGEEEMMVIPNIGRVAAGLPLFSHQNFDGYVKVVISQLIEGEYFALQIKGDSMQNAGILDGDTAVVRHQVVANNGDIIVAQINEQITLKRFFRERSRIRLQPENDLHPPIYSRSVTILGKLKMVVRSYSN